MHHRLKWFIRLRAKALSKGDGVLMGYSTLYLTSLLTPVVTRSSADAETARHARAVACRQCEKINIVPQTAGLSQYTERYDSDRL